MNNSGIRWANDDHEYHVNEASRVFVISGGRQGDLEVKELLHKWDISVNLHCNSRVKKSLRGHHIITHFLIFTHSD